MFQPILSGWAVDVLLRTVAGTLNRHADTRQVSLEAGQARETLLQQFGERVLEEQQRQ
jgi:hypothetical protein